MKLQLNRNHIHSDLFEELGFEDYLKKFEIHLPFINHLILSPLPKAEGKLHFEQLKLILNLSLNNKIQIDELIALCSRILPLENVFSSLLNRQLEQYQLYLIYTFIEQEFKITKIEKELPLEINLSKLKEIQETLNHFCEEGAKIIRFSKEELDLKNKIFSSDKLLEKKLQEHESKILEETGLSFLYPYPREIIDIPPLLLEKIKNSKLLSLKKKSEFYEVNHIVSQEIEELEKSIRHLRDELENEIKNRLEKLGEILFPYAEELILAYEKRKKRAYLYALIKTLHQFNLCLPTFSENEFEIKKGHLPCLQQNNLENYVPLDLKMKGHGAHVLFGANMAGKTSVLKTQYFLLTLLRFGLPIPAEEIRLGFPNDVQIHLKNSGKIKQKLSGFADELTFFSQGFESGAYLLVDELFHSTNPLAGLQLSKIFLHYYSTKNVLLFCTSFYPEVLYLDEIHFYKMVDATLDLEVEKPINEILSQTPFRVEKVEKHNVGKSFWECQQPLKLALHFPLNDELKKNILAAIKE